MGYSELRLDLCRLAERALRRRLDTDQSSSRVQVPAKCDFRDSTRLWQQSSLPLAEVYFAADVRLMAWCAPAGRREKNPAVLLLLTRRVPGGQERLSESDTGQLDSAVQHRQCCLSVATSSCRIQNPESRGPRGRPKPSVRTSVSNFCAVKEMMFVVVLSKAVEACPGRIPRILAES